MEFQKITNFLDITSDNKDLPKFVTKKWIEVYDQSEGNYNVNKEIRIKTSMLRSDLCAFSDAYIFVKEIFLLLKKHLLLMTLMHLIIQQLTLVVLILQIIMLLVIKSYFLMHHLSIVFQKLMV